MELAGFVGSCGVVVGCFVGYSEWWVGGSRVILDGSPPSVIMNGFEGTWVGEFGKI